MTLFNTSLGPSLASGITLRRLGSLCSEANARQVSRYRPKPHWSPRIAACALASWQHFELPTFLFIALPRRLTWVSTAVLLPTDEFRNTRDDGRVLWSVPGRSADEPGVSIAVELIRSSFTWWSDHPAQHRAARRTWNTLRPRMEHISPTRRWRRVGGHIAAVITTLLDAGWNPITATCWEDLMEINGTQPKVER